ncbi:SPOR domain-containing protein [Altericroceibacterium spongiae]|uniref:SPOR domain-containing protein n=1 Tax=Altericroceibacterium spongiae TaxID=2320269 RepID=A0A420EK80_9SPHN|nr:SPOR domain-containing protein [Altericroceibacterium spongiae]RKF21132.1 SPOR domain-containing protein [Altericroceibacterium spongiae]
MNAGTGSEDKRSFASEGLMNLGDPVRDGAAFADDESLPWLEADEEEDGTGVDSSRIIGFALAGFLILAVIVGGLWWYFNASDETTLMPDGSTVAAPEGPYKTKPEDPGGMTYRGTGDTSFAVGEGQSREGRVAETPLEPEKSAQAAQADTKREAIAQPAEKGQSPGVGVQVGAYTSKESARQGWVELTRRYSSLDGVKHRIVEGQADIGHVFRLQAVAATRAEAKALCNALKAQGGACQVKR